MTKLEDGITESRLKYYQENCDITDEEIKEILENQRKVGQIEIYVRILQEGDPENENPKKILDEIDKVLERII